MIGHRSSPVGDTTVQKSSVVTQLLPLSRQQFESMMVQAWLMMYLV